MKDDEFGSYLVTYQHDGSEWVLEIKAASMADAQARLSKLAYGRVDGKLVAKIPASVGWIARIAVLLRNTMKRPRPHSRGQPSG